MLKYRLIIISLVCLSCSKDHPQSEQERFNLDNGDKRSCLDLARSSDILEVAPGSHQCTYPNQIEIDDVRYEVNFNLIQEKLFSMAMDRWHTESMSVCVEGCSFYIYSSSLPKIAEISTQIQAEYQHAHRCTRQEGDLITCEAGSPLLTKLGWTYLISDLIVYGYTSGELIIEGKHISTDQVIEYFGSK